MFILMSLSADLWLISFFIDVNQIDIQVLIYSGSDLQRFSLVTIPA